MLPALVVSSAVIVAVAVVVTMIAAPISWQSTFPAAVVASITNMASTIPRLVPAEVVEGPVIAIGKRSVITVMRIPAIIDMAVKTTRAVEPGAGSDKHSAHIPIGSIVAIGGAIVGRIVEVTVGAYRRSSNIYANGNLSRRCVRAARQGNGENRKSKSFADRHRFSFDALILLET